MSGILLSLVLTVVSYLVGYEMKWITDINYLEAFSVFTSYWCTYLCVFQSRFNYIIGAISVTALGVLFYQQSLFGSAALQAYLFPALLYGWFRWGPDDNTRSVTNLKFDINLLWYVSITTAVYVFCYFVNIALGGTMALLDTAILVLSILAQFMLDNKKLENWYVWIIVDIISVYEYVDQGLYIVAIQMGLFGLNALWGLYEWNKTKNNIRSIGIKAVENELLTT